MVDLKKYPFPPGYNAQSLPDFIDDVINFYSDQTAWNDSVSECLMAIKSFTIQREKQHEHDRYDQGGRCAEQHNTDSFEQQEHSQQHDPSPKSEFPSSLVGKYPSQRTRENVHHTEQTGYQARFFDPEFEIVNKV